MRKTVAPMQGVGAAFLYGCLLLLLLHQEVVVGVTAQYLSTAELSSQSQCYSFPGSTSTVANAPVGGYPDNTLGASVYTSSIESPNLKLRCLEVFFDRSPTINESYAATCLSYSWKINVCVVNVATGVESCNLTMNNAFIYNSSSRPASWSAGDTYFSQGFNSQLRIRWLPNATMPVSCYPMYFTTVAVVENNSPGSTSSLATVIIFVAIAGVVLVILLFFGRYQLRKVLSKFGKKVSTKPRKSEFDGIERDVPTAHGNYYDDEQQDMKAVGVPMDDETEEDFRQRYGVHAIRSHGRQQAELIDGVKVTARPMIQPWYERNSFISPNANRKGGVERYATQPPQQQANGAAPIAMQVAHILGPDGGGSSVRRRQPSPQFSIEGSAQRQPPLYMDPSINASMQYAQTSGLYDEEPAVEGPRRLQFASPTQQQPRQQRSTYEQDVVDEGAFVTSPPQYATRLPQARTINPYED